MGGVLRWGAWLAVAAVVAAAGFWISSLSSPEIVQPVNFSHEKHVAMKLPCAICHKYTTTRRIAGRPGVAVCAVCHAATPPTSPEMAKLRGFIDRKQEIPWRRVYKVPPHVFFTHRTHVVDAKLSCETCHGPVGKMKTALTRPLKPISMDTCIGCHRKSQVKIVRNALGLKANGDKKAVRSVTTDCNACHK